jgi:hypothetical protein
VERMKKGLKMATRYEIAKNLLIKYKEASKREKKEILIKRFYFPILGIDSNRKNDSAFVEQKNW